MLTRQRLYQRSKRPSFTALYLLESSGDSPHGFQKFVAFKELLIRGSALDDDLGLAIHREDCGLPGLLKLPDEAIGVPLKLAQGMDVLKIDHACNLQQITDGRNPNKWGQPNKITGK